MSADSATSYRWWRFWSAEPWKEWWNRRPAWKEYRGEARRLDSLIAERESTLSTSSRELAAANQQLSWSREVHPQETPTKIARSETALATVPGVTLFEIRKREGHQVWTPVDHGFVYLTDKQAIFAGSKNVKFRYDTIITSGATTQGLHIDTSARKRSHILGGPAEKIAALMTACEAFGRGESPTAPFEAKAESLRMTTDDIERQLDRIRSERSSLAAPPRPISPAWMPASLLLAAVLGTGVIGEAQDPEMAVVAGPTTTSTPEPSTTVSTISTTVRPTTTTTSGTPSTAVLLVANGDVIFAPPASGPSGDPGSALPTKAATAMVVSITDGDTLNVRLEDGSVERVRLIGVNAPETNECWADEAEMALASLVSTGHRVGLTSDVTDRDDFNRLLRYLWVGGMSVNEELVRRGAAIARRYAPDTAMAPRLEAAQLDAKGNQLGVWAPDACGPPAEAKLVINHIEFDPPGDDNADLNAEWIRVKNSGANLVDMTGWGIRDESASNRFEFPSGFALAPGESATIRSGCGDNFGTTLFWCSVGTAIWNNDGDTAFLTDPNGSAHQFSTYQGTTTTTSSTSTTTTTQPQGGSGEGGCHPSYKGACVPMDVSDVDCLGGSGDGPAYVGRVTVIGYDEYRLDNDGDGIGCDSS